MLLPNKRVCRCETGTIESFNNQSLTMMNPMNYGLQPKFDSNWFKTQGQVSEWFDFHSHDATVCWDEFA